ncbi:RNA-binding protein snRNP, partial [mine drainage metagenome]
GLTRGDAAGGLRVLLELFGTGNLIVGQGETIAAAATVHRWAHRTVRPGSPYARAPARPDPWTLSKEAVEDLLLQSRSDLTSTLAARLGLGGPLAEETVARLGVDGGAPATDDASGRAARIVDALRGLLDELGPAPAGWLYRRGNAPVDVTPFAARRWSGVADIEVQTYPTFSE